MRRTLLLPRLVHAALVAGALYVAYAPRGTSDPGTAPSAEATTAPEPPAAPADC